MPSIETEENMTYLLHSILLKRYSIMIDGEATHPVNVIEKAVDLHALRVIGSSGYQKCIDYLWRGWLVQDEDDPASFVDFKGRDDTRFLPHLDPDRMRAPVYQNAAQLLISLIYLALYTGAINTINPDGDLDFVEGLLYLFTLGFICDELTKIWKAGWHMVGFWNAFNFCLYSVLVVSLALRFVAYSKPLDGSGEREHFNQLSYNFLAFASPMFWGRLLLYLDSFRFFGAMLVVVKVMMRESIIFFALLIVMIIGFLQAFIGMDYADDMAGDDTIFIMQAMANAIMQSPDFTGFERFSPPFGIILYYLFTFIVMVRNPVHHLPKPRTDKPRSSFLMSLSLCTTVPTKTFTKTPTTNSSPCFPKRRCSLCARRTRTSSLLLSISLRSSSSSFPSNGGCRRRDTSS